MKPITPPPNSPTVAPITAPVTVTKKTQIGQRKAVVPQARNPAPKAMVPPVSPPAGSPAAVPTSTPFNVE